MALRAEADKASASPPELPRRRKPCATGGRRATGVGRPPGAQGFSLAAPVLILIGLTASAGAQPATFPATSVVIDIAIAADGAATIAERYASTGGVRASDFEYLSSPCAAIEHLSISGNGRPIAFSTAVRGPWVTVRPEFGDGEPPTSLELRILYDARVSGEEMVVPVVLPAVPLAAGDDFGAGPVALHVTLPEGSAVLLPQMRHVAGRWTAGLPAIPSMVRATRGPLTRLPPCVEHERATDSTGAGALGRVFYSFVATLVLWVPLYFWWARGRRGGP